MAEAARNSAVARDRNTGFDLSEEEVDDAISAGTIIADRYRVLSTLGAGGMGTVYLAEHLTVGRTVAIKVLSGEWSGQSFVARRFQAEARIASAIGHPNIVEVFDAGQLPDRRLFLVMEHLEGRDLAEEIDEHGTLSQLRTAEILRQVALALAAAHNVGVIHRDLKPGNVMIASRASGEVVKILDFGIACNPRATARDGQRLTLPGSVIGTPDYMAPEQSTSAEPTPRFDVYALGAMAFEMLAGQPPIDAEDTYELLVRKRQTPSPSLATHAPHVHPEFVALIDDCLQILPARRPLDASAFLERLDAFIDALPDDDQAAEPRPAMLSSTPAQSSGRLVVGSGSSLLAPHRPPPAVPTLPTSPRASDPSRRAALALLLGALALAVGAWLWLTNADRAAPLPFAEAALTGEPVEPALPAAPPPAAPPLTATSPGPRDPPPEPTLPPVPAPALAGEAGPAETGPAGATTTPAPGAPRPSPGKRAFASSECARFRARAEEARNAQNWGLLRELSRRRTCWPSDADARKLQTKALMELGDFSGCVSAGQGLDDREVVQWRKLCQRRAG